MASSEVSIIFQAVDKASKTIGKIGNELDKTSKAGTKGFAALASNAKLAWSAVGVGVGVVTAAGAAIKSLADKFQNYAFQVEDFGRIIGATPEEASKLIQVADDVRLSVESMTAAMRGAITKGYAPTVANLAQMSDAYLKLEPGIERSRYLVETFGRAGLEMGKLLELGSEKIQEMGDSVEGTARLMTQQGINAAKDYYAAMDQLGEAAENVTLALGQQATGAVTDFTNVLNSAATGISAVIPTLLKLQETAGLGWEDANAAVNGYFSGLYDLNDLLKIIENATASYNGEFGALEKRTREANAAAWLYVKGLGAQSDATEQASENAKKLESAMGNMSDVTEALSEDLLFNKAAANLDIDAQLELGRAFGKVDENTIRLYRQLDRLNKIYDTNGDGAISAAEATGGYIQAVTRLRQEIAGLQSKQIDIVVNFWDNRSRLAGALPQAGGYNPLNTPNVNKAVLDAKLKGVPKTPPAQDKKDDAGGASGLSMIVPPGYPNDSFKIGATSGEKVDILTPRQQSSGSGMYVNITINGGGQSPQAIAQAVIRQLNASMRSARQSGLGYVGS